MKKLIKKSIVLGIVFTLIILSMTGCGGKNNKAKDAKNSENSNENKAPVVLKFGHCHPVSSQFHLGAQKFAELVSEKTNGQLKIDVYHDSQLGDEGELTEGVKMGTVDMALVATGNLAKYEQKYSIFDLPYLFKNNEHADKVLNGEVGKTLAELIEAKGIKLVDFWESGFRHYLNNKRPIKTPADMKGLKIRTPDWPVLIDTTKMFGANVVPMAFSELYMACQQGVVDGQEGPVFAIKSAKMYEVQKYMVLDGHTYAVMGVIMNPDKFNSLSPELQKALLEAAKEAGIYERKLLRDNEKEEIKFLETEGKMMIEKNPDKEEWRKAVEPVYQKYSKQLGEDLIQKIIDTK